jgi:monoamine oxidase
MEWDPLEYFQNNLVPVGGFTNLIRDAAAGLDIRLGSEVKKIVWGNSGVAVVTRDEIFSADLAVLSVPLGVLKSDGIRFEPRLSAEKTAVIHRIGFGGRAVLNKIVLCFSRRFWPAKRERFACLPSDLPRREAFLVWMDQESVTGAPVLVGFASGDISAELDQAASDMEICEEALAVLRRMFSRRIPEPVAYRITRWLSDPWSLGSYSYAAVNVTEDDRKRLAAPIHSRLFFTGEATHETHYGTVQGALLAGEREALRIHHDHCCQCCDKTRLPWHRSMGNVL